MARRFGCETKLRAVSSVGTAAAEPLGVWARAGIGTTWLAAMEDARCGRHGYLGGEFFPPFAPDDANNQVMCTFVSIPVLSSF